MVKADRFGELIIVLYYKYLLGVFPIINLVAASVSFIYSRYKYGRIDIDALYMPYKLVYVWNVSYEINFSKDFIFFSFRLPWNQHTLIGWMVETIFYLNSASTFLFVNAVFLTFFITICEYHSAFYELFRSEIERMNGMIELHQNVKRIICDSIKLHAAAKK